MKKIIVFFMALLTLVTLTSCGTKPEATISNETISRSSYTFDLKVEDKNIVTKGSVLVNFYKLDKKDEELTTTKTLSTFSETVTVTGLESNSDYRADVLCTYNKKSHIIYSWTFKTNEKGTEYDPIEITTPAELVDNIAKDYSSDAFYVLANDIDFSEYKDDEGNVKTFDGMSSTSATAFAGHLDGNGHSIKNVTVTSAQTYNGLFGYLKGYISNLTLENVTVNVERDSSTTTYSGILAGYSYQAKVNNVNLVNSTITVKATTQYTGGLVGYGFASNYNYCKATGLTINSNNSTTAYVGGITSYLCQNSNSKFGKIYNSSVEGAVNITAASTVYYGGLVGLLKAGSEIDRGIANINALIKSNNTTKAGGLVGIANLNSVKEDTYIKNVVAKGLIAYKSIKETEVEENSSSMYIGGLIGSATTVLVDSAYIEIDLDIVAKAGKDKELFSGLVFGNGYEFHTGLTNAIINGSITATTTDSDAEAKISIHGYDGSVYGTDEKPSSMIDLNTVKYVKIGLTVDGTDYSYPETEAIAFENVPTVATWNKNIWDFKIVENKSVITFKN